MAFAALAFTIDFAGIAGYRGGLVIAAVPLCTGFGLVVWKLTSRTNAAVTWALAAGILGLVVTAVLGTRAPLSRGALQNQIEGLDLPFFDIRSTHSSGHSWCQPSCPEVERTYAVPDVGVQSTAVTAGLALVKAGLLTQDDLRSIRPVGGLRVRSERVEIDVRIDQDEGGAVRSVRIRYSALRPR